MGGGGCGRVVAASGGGPAGGGMRRVWSARGVLVVAVVAVVAGCTPGGPGPTSSASVSEVVTSSPTPTPSMGSAVGLPDKPELWEGTGELGAKAAAVWFVRDLYRYVLETNDTTEWERLSTEDCEFCAGKVEMAREVLWSTAASSDRTVMFGLRDSRRGTQSPFIRGLGRTRSADDQRVRSGGQWAEDFPPESAQMLVILHREGPDWRLRAGEPFAPRGRAACLRVGGRRSERRLERVLRCRARLPPRRCSGACCGWTPRRTSGSRRSTTGAHDDGIDVGDPQDASGQRGSSAGGAEAGACVGSGVGGVHAG